MEWSPESFIDELDKISSAQGFHAWARTRASPAQLQRAFEGMKAKAMTPAVEGTNLARAQRPQKTLDAYSKAVDEAGFRGGIERATSGGDIYRKGSKPGQALNVVRKELLTNLKAPTSEPHLRDVPEGFIRRMDISYLGRDLGQNIKTKLPKGTLTQGKIPKPTPKAELAARQKEHAKQWGSRERARKIIHQRISGATPWEENLAGLRRMNLSDDQVAALQALHAQKALKPARSQAARAKAREAYRQAEAAAWKAFGR